MHASSHFAANPFGMLIDPEAITRTLEGCTQRLERLNRRVCRPLDRVAAPKGDGKDCEAFDASIEIEPDADVIE